MKPIVAKIIALYDTVTVTASLAWPQSALLLFLRVFWGIDFIQTGWGKLHNLPQVTEFFASLGIPAPGINAAFIGALEFGGGILLLIGLFSRLTAIPLSIAMVVAYFTADFDAVNALFSANYAEFFEASPWPFLLVSLLVLLFGPGRFSVDAILKSRFQPSSHP